MLGLPKSTELSRQLPKKAIYTRFGLNTAGRNRFDADISRITIVNEVSPSTVAIAPGESIKSFYVLLVALKHKKYDERLIGQLSKLIDQNMLFILDCDDKSQLAVYHGKVITSGWKPGERLTITLKGQDMDAVWQNIIMQVGDIYIEQGRTLDEQLAFDEQQSALEDEIDRLEKLAWKETQPKKKFELAQKINEFKEQLSEFGNESRCN